MSFVDQEGGLHLLGGLLELSWGAERVCVCVCVFGGSHCGRIDGETDRQ